MLLFIILSLTNVILGTLKSISKINGNRHAMAIQTISYTFYAATVKLMGSYDMWFIIAVAIFTNIIGYYLAEWIFSKHLAEEKTWRISVTVPIKDNDSIEEIKTELKYRRIAFNKIFANNNKSVVLDIFSTSRRESRIVKDILTDKKCKYHVMPINQQL